jgi:hypothetical protein
MSGVGIMGQREQGQDVRSQNSKKNKQAHFIQ